MVPNEVRPAGGLDNGQMTDRPLLSSLGVALRADENVLFALAFGSTAAGADQPSSDVDLLVDLNDPSLDQVLDLTARLEDATGRRVDLVRLSDAEVDPLFLADVLAEGHVLIDRAERWPRLRGRESNLRQRGEQLQAERIRSALAGIDHLLERQQWGRS